MVLEIVASPFAANTVASVSRILVMSDVLTNSELRPKNFDHDVVL